MLYISLFAYEYASDSYPACSSASAELCQTCEPPLWQTACDKKADIPDAYPPSLFRRTLPSFPQNLVLAKEALYAAKEGLQAGKEDV